MNDENQTNQNPAGQAPPNPVAENTPSSQEALDAELNRIKGIAENENANVNQTQPPVEQPQPTVVEAESAPPPAPEPSPEPITAVESQPVKQDPQPQPQETPQAQEQAQQPSQGVPLPNLTPEGENKSSKTLIIIATVLFVLSIVGIGLYYLGMKKSSEQAANEPIPSPTQTATPSATIDPLADWKVFTDETYGLSFKYPPTAILVNKNYTGYLASYQITSPDNLDVTFYVGTQDESSSYTDTKQVMVGDIQAVQVSLTGGQNPPQELVFFNQGDKYYHFQMIWDGQNQELLQTFNQILSTFEFVEPTASSSASPSVSPTASSSATASPSATP
jgi:hypothetical protein